jgi:peptidoglycan hydrolase-like protein with peptidoglycan-binding domain
VARSKAVATVIGVVVIVAAVVVGAMALGFGSGSTAGADDSTTGAPTPTQSSDASPTPPATDEPTATPSPTASPTPSTTPSPTPSPTPEALMAPGDSGDEVRKLQSRLKQIQWYEPKISGEYDDATVAAVKGFQAKRELPETGQVDQATWDALVAMTREPTDDEMHNRLVPGPTILGPGDTGNKVRELQARLKQIGWFDGDVTNEYGDATKTAVAGFQVKREIPETGEVDQRTWDKLAAMTREPTDDELHNREPEPEDPPAGDQAGLDPRCLTGSVMCIDKSSSSLRWVVDGKVKMTFDVRFGSELTPTREGAFSVGWKSRDHVSSLYDTPMPYAMFFSGGQAVHYSPDFASNGYNGSSHGCVNVRDKDGIAALFDQVDVGDKVIVYWS